MFDGQTNVVIASQVCLKLSLSFDLLLRLLLLLDTHGKRKQTIGCIGKSPRRAGEISAACIEQDGEIAANFHGSGGDASSLDLHETQIRSEFIGDASERRQRSRGTGDAASQ